jgi:hypothetical protein
MSISERRAKLQRSQRQE